MGFASQPYIGNYHDDQEGNNCHVYSLPAQGLLHGTGGKRRQGDGSKYNKVIQGLGFGFLLKRIGFGK